MLFPSWDIWHVRSVYPKPSETWHARPAGAPTATIDADSLENLIATIRDQEASM